MEPEADLSPVDALRKEWDRFINLSAWLEVSPAEMLEIYRQIGGDLGMRFAFQTGRITTAQALEALRAWRDKGKRNSADAE